MEQCGKRHTSRGNSAGSTSTNFSVAGISSTGSYIYNCLVSAAGNGCTTVTSNSDTVTVIPDPTLTLPSFTNTSICSGGSTTVSSTISGGTGIPIYQWQYYNGASWNDVVNGTPAGTTYTNATTSTMTISGTTIAGTYEYRLKTSNFSGCDYTSAGATYTVVAIPSITTQPSTPSAICVGGAASISLVAAGGTPSLTYQWQYFNGSWNNVTNGTPAGTTYTGSTSNSLSVSGFSSAGSYQYQCIVSASGNGCSSATSNSITVTVVADPNITLQPVSPASICTGGTANISISAAGGTPSLNYQWQYYNGTSWNNVTNGTPTGASYTGSTSTSFSVTGISVAGNYQYQCLVSATGNGCSTATSSSATVTVVPDPFITVQPTDTTICSGTTATLAVIAGGGTPSLSYQWQYYNGSLWTTAPGVSTNASYTTQSLAASTQFRVLVSASGGGCDPVTSNTITVHIPHISVQPATTTNICSGGTTTLNVVASSDGGTATYAYQWQVSAIDCSTGFFDISGANSSSYTTPVLTSNRFYNCLITVSNPSCSVLTSNCATVNAIADPAITIQPSGTTICSGSTATLSVTATGGTPSLTYQWQSSSNLAGPYLNVSGGSGSTTAIYTTAVLASTTYFQVLVSAGGNGCGTATSVPVAITVSSSATANAGGNNSICSMGYYTISTATATNYSSLLWITSGTGSFNNPTAINPTYTPSAADIIAGSVTLTLTAYSVSPCINASNSMTLTINQAPTANAGPDQSLCSITSTTMAGNVPTSGTGTWTRISGPNNPAITNANLATTTITGMTAGT